MSVLTYGQALDALSGVEDIILFENFRFSLKRSLENWMVMVLWFTEREIELYYLFEFEALLMRLH